MTTEKRCSRSNPGLRLWKPAAESCSRRPTLMQVLVHGMDLNAASSFRAACFHTSIGAGDTLKRSQPRESDRHELPPLEHLRGTVLVWVAHAAAGSSLRRLPCFFAARLLVFSLRCSPRPFFTRCHPLVRAPPHGGCHKRRGGSERSRAVWRRWKRAGTAVNATETGRRGLGTVPSGDGHCLARA